VCTSAQYETSAPTATANRGCAALVVCASDVQYQSRAPTSTTDRDCASLTPCSDGEEYESTAPSASNDRGCSSLTTCSATTQFESVAPTATSDRVCGEVASRTAAPTLAPVGTAAPVGVVKVTGSFSLGGIAATSKAEATSDAVKADLAAAIRTSLSAESVTIDTLVASSNSRRLQPSAAQRRLATYTLEVQFTATFATKVGSDAAVKQVSGSRAVVASSIQQNLRGSSNAVLSAATVNDLEAQEKSDSESGCARLSGQAREVCEKAAGNTAAVVGGVIGAVVLLAIAAKVWQKMKYQTKQYQEWPDQATRSSVAKQASNANFLRQQEAFADPATAVHNPMQGQLTVQVAQQNTV
jgi:hypothetical protein